MIELTARLTLQSCVSQLTEFTTREIIPEFLDNGFQKLVITLCDDSGEVLPFVITLIPCDKLTDDGKLLYLSAYIKVNKGTEDTPDFYDGYEVTIFRLTMTHRQMLLCALHTCGDYIKFYTKKG